MVHKFFDEKAESGLSIKEQIAKELHKPVIKKFKRRKVYMRFKDNIWAVHLAQMESWSSNNKHVKYLWCVYMD